MKKDLLICATFSLFLFSTAKAQTCEPEVPMQCAGKSVGQWVAEEKARRCTPNPGIPGETITKCEVLVPWYNVHVGTYCRLDVLAIDPRAPNVEYSRSTAIYPNCPLNANGSTDYVLNGLTGTCQKFCPTPPDIPIPDRPSSSPPFCPKSPPPVDGTSVGNPILPALAEKVQIEGDISLKGPHPFSLVRIYRSGRVRATTDLFAGYGFPSGTVSASSGSSSGSSGSSSSAGATLGNASQFPEPTPATMGAGWSTSAIARIRVNPSQVFYMGEGVNITFVRLNWIYMTLPGGGYRTFKPHNENTWISVSSTAPGVTDQSAYRAEYVTLSYANDGSGRPLYTYHPFGSDEQLTFKITSNDFLEPTNGKQGILTEIRSRNGWVHRIEPDITAPEDAPRPAQCRFAWNLTLSNNAW